MQIDLVPAHGSCYLCVEQAAVPARAHTCMFLCLCLCSVVDLVPMCCRFWDSSTEPWHYLCNE